MSHIVDRRNNSRHKSAVNRHRFIQRFKQQIRKSVADAISERSITNFQRGEKINIPTKDTHEPILHHGENGVRSIILPGNHDYLRGDKIPKPPKQAASTDNQASDQGEGEDNFSFELSREEFLDIFFDDLELPHLLKKEFSGIDSPIHVKSGYTSYGTPANLNVVRSMRSALARRIAIGSPKQKRLAQAEKELVELLKSYNTDDEIVKDKQAYIEKLKSSIAKIPFIDPFDLKYNNKVLQPAPRSKAVMFCIMDVSGSMDETKKELAKRFFILLYIFLTKNYDTIEIIFIRHHTSAKEVNEKDFFYSRETGGTVVSSALELMADIIHDRYPTNEWNIYGAQASDGDNWNNDSPHCREVLINRIMPYVQYYAYIEILPRNYQSLWNEYLNVREIFNNFAMQAIHSAKEIYPVLRDLFKKQYNVVN